jgi:phosphohistidine phosphatase
MKIFLIRHAEAIDLETGIVSSDDFRFLTPKGRKVSRTVFRKLKEELANPGIVFTSPLIRAVQTAEILANTVRFENELEIANELATANSVGEVLKLVKRNTVFDSIVLVGHEPMMGMIVHSVSEKKDPSFSFKKSGVCRLDYDNKEDEWKFIWYYNPKTNEFIK